MKLFDLAHPFFKPVWVRVVVVIVCFVWGLVEIAGGNTFWAIFFIGLSVICGQRFATIDYAAIADPAKEPRQND
ncbi:MAG: hypothetical protein ABJO29_02175 [Yoonia sp.]|uniref:hypothetical protein n=1 Tax=Yoonia sp. TaxID=2212373 RepID=UPI0032677DBA